MRTTSAVFSVLLLAHGCGASRAVPPRGSAPHGIVAPANATPGENYRGLYLAASGTRGAWIAPEATLTVRSRANARRLVLVTYVPNARKSERAQYAAHPLTISVRFAGAKPQIVCCLRGGIAGTHFRIPADAHAADGSVTFRVRVTGASTALFEGSGKTRRPLGIVIVRTFTY